MNNSPGYRNFHSPLGFANLENVAINNQDVQKNLTLENHYLKSNPQSSTINSTLSPLLNQLSLQISNSDQNSKLTNNNITSNNSGQPYVRIIEQPARCALRFRYECEGRSAGSIPGCNSTTNNKTYPTIEIVNYNGPAVVVVSCVTKQQPHRPHPHNLVGKEGCKKGVCTLIISNNQMRCTFTSLGIQCVKKKDIEESLKLRESIKVDPYRTGFAHRSHVTTMDLNVVRLCFQVFIEGNEKEKFNVPLQPVVSDPIYDKKAMSDLNIIKLSHCSASISGGQEIILLCDRITKDDIQVKIYEEHNGNLIWETFADFQPNDVHKQVAISFRVPKYYQEFISTPITVFIQLRRPSDGHLSDPRPFQYIPNDLDQYNPKIRKRQKYEDNLLENNLSSENKKRGFDLQQSEFCVPRISMNHLQTDNDQLGLRSSPFFNPQVDLSSSPLQQIHSPESNFSKNTNFLPENMTNIQHNYVKNETTILDKIDNSFLIGPNTYENQSRFGSINQIKEEPSNNVKIESLELDIDANDLISDINFNNMMVMMDSGNNISFNSSGNIKMEVNSNLNYGNDNIPNSLIDINMQSEQKNF